MNAQLQGGQAQFVAISGFCHSLQQKYEISFKMFLRHSFNLQSPKRSLQAPGNFMAILLENRFEDWKEMSDLK